MNWTYRGEGMPPENILLELAVVEDDARTVVQGYAQIFQPPGKKHGQTDIEVAFYSRVTGDRIECEVYAFRVFTLPEPPPYPNEEG